MNDHLLYEDRTLEDKVRGSAEYPHIATWMRDVLLTPFVGAAVSANRLNGSDEYKAIFHALHGEIRDLRKKLGAENTAAQAYLDHFCNRYVEPRQPYEYRPEPVLNNDLPCALASRAFRQELIKVIIELSRRFNASAAESRMFYFSNRAKRVELRDEDYATYVESMLDALDALLVEAGRVPGKKSFQYIIINGMWNRLIKRYARSGVKAINYDEKPNPPFPTLDVEHLTWLSDILWLSLIVWHPLYPDSHEMGVELSLVSDDPRTPSWDMRLSRTAETFLSVSELNLHVKRRFAELNPDPARLAEAMNCLVMDTHLLLGARALETATTHDGSSLPVIVTTNLDRGIEAALEGIIKAPGSKFANAGYRVIYPVLVRRASPPAKKARRSVKALGAKGEAEQSKYRLVWVARDWTASGEVYRWITDSQNESEFTNLDISADQLVTSGQSCLEEYELCQRPLDRDGLIGPVIVKMHGSPLDPREPLKTDLLDFKRYVILSEHQYLDFIIKEAVSAPRWLTEILSETHVLFLGYSMTDWNVRLQFAKGSRSNKPEPKRSALVLNVGRPEGAILQRLGINFTERDMALAAKALYHDLHGSLPKTFQRRMKYLQNISP